MCEKLQEDSIFIRVTHEELVDNLKNELCRSTHNSRDECYLEPEDKKNKIDKEFYLDTREECFEGREKNVEVKEIEAAMNAKERDKEATSEKLEDAIEHEESDEVFENDNEGLLWKMFEAENEEEVESEVDHESEEREFDVD